MEDDLVLSFFNEVDFLAPLVLVVVFLAPAVFDLDLLVRVFFTDVFRVEAFLEVEGVLGVLGVLGVEGVLRVDGVFALEGVLRVDGVLSALPVDGVLAEDGVFALEGVLREDGVLSPLPVDGVLADDGVFALEGVLDGVLGVLPVDGVLAEEGVLAEAGVLAEDGVLAVPTEEGVFTFDDGLLGTFFVGILMDRAGFLLTRVAGAWLTDFFAAEAALGMTALTLGATFAATFPRPPRARDSRSLLTGTATTTERVARPRPVTVLKRISDDS